MKNTLVVLFNLFFGLIVFSQNGKIISKSLIDLSKTPIWNTISKNDSLTQEYNYLKNLNFYFITYQSDKLVIDGILSEPKSIGKYPVIIYNRGGNRNFGKLTVGQLIMATSKLCSQGYIIIASNYRKIDEFGGSEINDVLCLTETIKELNNADSTKIGMLGWSRGGMMAYLAISKSTKIKSIIIGNGPTNLLSLKDDRPEMEKEVYLECIPNYLKNKEEELKKRSVIFWVDKLNKNCRLLILCGTKDDRVNPKQVDELAEKLNKINYPFELKKFETDHTFSNKRQELEVELIKWFNNTLKNEN